MVENSRFNDEWNKLQKSFWDNVSTNFTHLPHSTATDQGSDSREDNGKSSQPKSLFDQWLTDVDKCWEDHAQVASSDIDALYKKISSSSRFFFNFTESVSAMSKNETTDALVSKFTEEFTKTASENYESENNASDDSSSQKDAFNSADINSFWKLPLENWQQHASFYSTQQQTLGSLSKLFEDAINNPEFFAAVQSYLLALQKYQWVFFNLFTTAAKQTVEILKSNSASNKPSPKKIMSTWLEVFESNYMLLIVEESYSKAYADVVNGWMLMVSKSNKPFAEFMQTSMSSVQQFTSNTQS